MAKGAFPTVAKLGSPQCDRGGAQQGHAFALVVEQEADKQMLGRGVTNCSVYNSRRGGVKDEQ